MTPSFYQETETVRFYHCDPALRLKLSALNGFLAEIACTDYDKRGHSRQWLIDRDVIFLLSRVALRIHRTPCCGDVLTIRTWEDQIKGAQCIRKFECFGPEGDLWVSAESAWIVISPSTRQIRRPAAVADLFHPAFQEVDAPPCEKLRFPEGTPAGERVIRWSDLDGNGHTYNAKYSDIVMDVIPEALRKRPVREFQINFNHEALLGDTVSLSLHQEGDRAMVKGEVAGKDCFVCSLLFGA